MADASVKVVPDPSPDHLKMLAIADAFSNPKSNQKAVCSESVESTFERLERAKKWILDPQSSRMKIWDAIMFFLLLFTAAVTPYEVSFLETKINPLFVVNRIVDLGFICDMIAQFFRSYTDENGKNILKHRKIADRYLRSWFGIDFISVLPYDMVGYAFDNGDVSQLKLLRIVRLLRLLKLLRLIKAGHILMRYESQLGISFAMLALIKFIVILLTISHWCACAWYTVGSINMDEPSGGAAAGGAVRDGRDHEYSSWIEMAGIEHKSLFSKYIISLFFALSVVFSGAPSSIAE
jgi:hypothetical protein